MLELLKAVVDIKQLDTYFNENSKQSIAKRKKNITSYSRFVRLAKLALPSLAAVLVAILLVFPSFRQDPRDFSLDITRPKKGELEKLHVENTVFYITDKNNKVNNFVASNIDETEPGSKLIKLTNPEGIMPLNDKNWVNVKAPQGFFNQNTNLLELQQNVEMFYSEGMNIATEQAFFDFNSSQGYGNKPISGDGFIGKIKSDGFEFTAKDDILVFKGHSDITIKEESLKK
ncbi:MAG: LPS export ABC transporter periplasmic protein LptC [Alphaproteobacteria bacterium]|nr:LPS export ABC transporter periplasmic protein LptC [Alphaproteobacteria bacterium]